VLVADGSVLAFRHEVIREAIESPISPLRRTELHARVLSAMAQQPGRVDNALLAHHAEQAGLGMSGLSSSSATRAANFPSTRLDDAASVAQQAVELADELDGPSATMFVYPCSSIPSSMITASRRSASGRFIKFHS
jgi:hypothetical protein